MDMALISDLKWSVYYLPDIYVRMIIMKAEIAKILEDDAMFLSNE